MGSAKRRWAPAHTGYKQSRSVLPLVSAIAGVFLLLAACATRPPAVNRLALEKSPYLLQHAGNPIDWYPWGEEAFERARQEDKPIFLSIGYSTCHWCHVMERESFSDPEVGALLDEHFISIKVDREERPDVDAVYMAAARLLTPEPGWPLNVLLTPDGHAFYAASYIPRDDRPGAIGMRTLLPRIAETWANRRGDVTASAETIAHALRERVRPPAAEIGVETLERGFRRLSARFDEGEGGFLPAPKFPSPNELRFLLRWWKRTGDSRALVMVEETLQAIRDGGIYDQIGFGVHRYSTDEQWHVPHFEKMLYDQALLVLAAIEAYQATGNEEYGQTARETIEFMLRELQSPEGGFFSALSAETGAVEGAFYQWTKEELDGVLGAESGPVAAAWGIGATPVTPRRVRTSEELASELSTSVREIDQRLEFARSALLASRARRASPELDRKILADWNGLAITALAQAGVVLDEPAYIDAARRAADFVLRHSRGIDGELLHRSIDGSAGITGYLDDYAFVIQGFLTLYEASGEIRYLEEAVVLERETARLFREEDGSYYLTAVEDSILIDRPRDMVDDEVPSGASVQLLNLIRLWHVTGDSALEQRARELLDDLSGHAAEQPAQAAHLLLVIDYHLGPAMEIVVAGDYDAPDTIALRREIFTPFAPNKVVLHRPPGEQPAISVIAPFTAMQRPAGDRTLVYVCVNQTCERPTGEPAVVRGLIDRNGTAD